MKNKPIKYTVTFLNLSAVIDKERFMSSGELLERHLNNFTNSYELIQVIKDDIIFTCIWKERSE